MLTLNAKLILGGIVLIAIYFTYTGAWYVVNKEKFKDYNQTKIPNLKPNIAKYFI